METAISYQTPDLSALPDGADVGVELYGGACTPRLDGENRGVYAGRSHNDRFTPQEEARRAFLNL